PSSPNVQTNHPYGDDSTTSQSGHAPTGAHPAQTQPTSTRHGQATPSHSANIMSRHGPANSPHHKDAKQHQPADDENQPQQSTPEATPPKSTAPTDHPHSRPPT